MKTLLSMLPFWVIASSVAFGTLIPYPVDRRPEVSLAEACSIAMHLLEAQGDRNRFYITGVTLFGSDEEDHSGSWNLAHHDDKGNRVNVYIQFPTGRIALYYFPRDGSQKVIEVQETAKKILAEQGSTGQPATRSKSESEDSDNPQPEAEGRSR